MSDSGLTRLSYELMDQRITLKVLSEFTTIPAALLSQYVTGHRQISRHHTAILAIALDISPNDLRKPTPPDLVVVDEDEWGFHNPMPMYRYRRTKAAG